jgi:hypothetical protein
MAQSQNGWPVVQNDDCVERTFGGAPIVNGWLRGDVDVVFSDLAAWLDKEIEASITPGCWGHHVKKIEGSDDYSNHSSGTAFDYNAPNHPMGKRNTYSAAKRDKIRARLRDRYQGVIRWGGDYSGRPDDMHFEVHANRAAVKAVADKIKKGAPVALTQAEIDKIANATAEQVWQYKLQNAYSGVEQEAGTILRFVPSRQGHLDTLTALRALDEARAAYEASEGKTDAEIVKALQELRALVLPAGQPEPEQGRA